MWPHIYKYFGVLYCSSLQGMNLRLGSIYDSYRIEGAKFRAGTKCIQLQRHFFLGIDLFCWCASGKRTSKTVENTKMFGFVNFTVVLAISSCKVYAINTPDAFNHIPDLF